MLITVGPDVNFFPLEPWTLPILLISKCSMWNQDEEKQNIMQQT